MLGTEPIESEIPVDYEDFPELVQQSILIYSVLTDLWDTMNGAYLGKDYSILFNLLDLYGIEIEDRLLVLSFLQRMDSIRSKQVSDKLKAKSPAK